MPILWKLILAIGLPLVALMTAALGLGHVQLKAEALRATEERVTELADRYAAEFNGAFMAIAQVAESAAAYLETDPNPTRAQLEAVLRRNVEANPLIYGSCAAFLPGEAKAWLTGAPPGEAAAISGGGLFGPYVYRGPAGLTAMQVEDAYDYTAPRWTWFGVPVRTGQAYWTEPFFDYGAGNVAMVTHSVPLRRGGRIVGVVTVDVRLESLRQQMMAGRPKGMEFWVGSREGALVLAPVAGWIMNETAETLAEKWKCPEVAELGRRMRAGERGAARIQMVTNEREPMLAFFAPVPSTGWSLAGVVEEGQIMAPVYKALRERTAFGLAIMVALLAVVIVMGSWIVRPTRRLAEAVGRLSAGDLDTHVEGVRAKDEIGRLATAFNSMMGQLKNHVEALERETAARQAVESELKVARSIQLSMLPREFPVSPAFEVAGVNAPAAFIGGDFYDAYESAPGVLTLVMADVSGHGVSAAMFMALARTTLRSLAADAGRARDPAELLTLTNAALARDNDAGFFVTIYLAQYVAATGRLRYANAGHPPPLVLGCDGRVRRMGEATGTLLGVFPESRYDEGEGEVKPGERLVLYTDGIPEARSPAHEFFGDERFAGLLAGVRNDGPGAICGRVLDELERFQGAVRHDDITLMVLWNRGAQTN
ncbi:MAG: SpoIIE family protein phosphatase [Phycisphaerales bacterium]|nr:SpoIIE family protein phosphatase [Phycisphaerales bacterium]